MIHLTLEGSCFGADLQAFLVSRGQFFRIVVSKAPQVGDLNLWNADEELFLFCRRHAALMRRWEENMSKLSLSE